MSARSRFAKTAHQATREELRGLAGIEVEKAQSQACLRRFGNGHPQQRPIAEAALDRLHPAFNLRRLAGQQIANRSEPGAVLIAKRQVQPQILHGEQAARRQFLRQRRAYAWQAADRRVTGAFRRWRRNWFGATGHSVENEDGVHLDLRAAREAGNLDGRAGRIRSTKIIGHHRVHRREIAQVGEVDSDSHHVVQ